MTSTYNSWLASTFGAPVQEEQPYDLNSPVARKKAAFQNINERMEYLEDIANKALFDTATFVNNLQKNLQDLQAPATGDIDVGTVTVDPLEYADRPELTPIEEFNMDMPELEKRLVLTPVDDSDLDGIEFPLFSIPDPEINEPEKPLLENLQRIPDAPPIRDIDIPTMSDMVLPTLPTITETRIPEMGDVVIPEFDATLLPWNISEPGQFTWGEPVYNSDIWADLLGKILHDIRNGGTGLGAQVEEDIYWQHLNRVQLENEKLVRDAENYFSSRGFTMPTGMLSAKINEALVQIGKNNLQASKDITISQAELAQKNTQFIIEQGRQLEGMMRQFFIDQANMSLNGQRAVAEHSIQLMNAQVARANLSLEEYKTKAGVWETKIKAAATQVDIFKAQIEGAKVTAETKKLLVDVYTAQLQGADMLVKIYLGKMQGASIQSDIEKTRMALYGEQIKAYLAKIELNKAKMMQYSAEWEGEKSKVSVYTARVQAYEARIAGMSKHLDGLIAKIGSRTEMNKLYVEEFKAYVSKYESDVRGKTGMISAKVDAFKASSQNYMAETDREKSYYQLKLGEIDAKIKNASFELQKAVAKIEASVKGFESVNRLRIAGGEGIMQVGAQLAASAIQGINTNASMSYQGGDSYSQSEGFQWSKSINIQRIEED
jgi:hypothetical protein